MTYGEAKNRVLDMMDELKPKQDLLGKLPGFFDAGQKEVAVYCPIWKDKEYTAGQARVLPEDCMAAGPVLVDGQVLCSWPQTWEAAQALPDAFTLRYRAWPQPISERTGDTEPLSVPEEGQQAVLLYVAAKCQEMEHDQRFFQNFFAEYQGQLANLSGRTRSVCWVTPAGLEL